MKLSIINKNNEILDLLNNTNKFILFKAEALHGIETDISESESPYMDGSNIDIVKALPRGIELTFKLVGEVKDSINFFTKYIKSKQFVTLREIEDDKDIIIKGVATIPPYSRMLQDCELTLTIYCGQPYWEDINYVVEIISEKIDLLFFPINGQYFTSIGRPFGVIDTSLEKTFINKGDVSVGMLLSLVALGMVTKPRISCSSGEQNGWYMQLNLTLQSNDEVKINTVKGNKYITINGSDSYNGKPILSYLEFKGLDWLQLETGANTFNVSTSGGATNSNVYFNINYKARYE
jgi:hypothetical protein|nr:MAG TPA: tail protein [Caudoviricetes sp.]